MYILKRVYYLNGKPYIYHVNTIDEKSKQVLPNRGYYYLTTEVLLKMNLENELLVNFKIMDNKIEVDNNVPIEDYDNQSFELNTFNQVKENLSLYTLYNYLRENKIKIGTQYDKDIIETDEDEVFELSNKIYWININSIRLSSSTVGLSVPYLLDGILYKLNEPPIPTKRFTSLTLIDGDGRSVFNQLELMCASSKFNEISSFLQKYNLRIFNIINVNENTLTMFSLDISNLKYLDITENDPILDLFIVFNSVHKLNIVSMRLKALRQVLNVLSKKAQQLGINIDEDDIYDNKPIYSEHEPLQKLTFSISKMKKMHSFKDIVVSLTSQFSNFQSDIQKLFLANDSTDRIAILNDIERYIFNSSLRTYDKDAMMLYLKVLTLDIELLTKVNKTLSYIRELTAERELLKYRLTIIRYYLLSNSIDIRNLQEDFTQKSQSLFNISTFYDIFNYRLVLDYTTRG